MDDGLPSNEVYQIVQDSTGKLLIATDRGAVQYDGYAFHTIPLKSNWTSKPVYYIYQSPESLTYLSSLQGIIYQYRNDTLYNFPFNDRITKLFQHPGILIANTISTHRDTTWISYNNDYNYNYKIGSCYVTPDGIVEKTGKNDGLYFDLQRNFHYRQSSPASNRALKQPLHILWENGFVTSDEVELNWRGSYIRRLFHIKNGDYDLFSVGRLLNIYKNRTKISSYRFPEHVLSITMLNEKEFYVGMENIGASLYRLENGTVQGPIDNHLNGFSVTCVLKDNQGGLWFSTLENGIYYLNPSQPHLWDNSSKIVSIEKGKGRVFVGFYSGLIQTFKNNKLVEEEQLPLNPGGYLLRFATDHNDSIIAITDKGYFAKKNGTWKLLPGKDILLLSTDEETLYGASASTAELHVYQGLGKPLLRKLQLSKRIISMFSNAPGQVWLGTWEGLLKYENGQLTDMSGISPVFNDRIVSINSLSDNSLVVASLSHGIAIYKNNKIFPLTVNNGLRSPIINSMLVHNDSIWVGSNKGLIMATFERDSFRTIHLGLESGLPSLDVQQFSVSNGWLYLKWVNKLVTLPLTDLLRTDKTTKTKITSVFVNDRVVSPSAAGSFTHNRNALAFQFTCVNLSSASQQEFVYKLDGFDQTWHRTMERNVKYTNLPPGNYKFHVKAINLKDNTVSTLSTYSFLISPAFWQQWWFPILAFTILSIIFLALFQMRLNAIKKKNTLLLELAENRQKVLVQLIHPHFVFNLMNTIQGAVLKEEKIVAASLIARLAKLMRLSMELSMDKWVSLEKEIDLLNKYFELEEVRSPGSFQYRIEAGPSVHPAKTMIPSMLIQPFVENAIKHGVMHLSGRKGQIHISFEQNKEALLCKVDDNGIGRKASEKINKAKPVGHQSSGIEITINRLRLLHQEQNTAFFYEVIDKENEQGEAKGTTVKFSIPIKKVYERDPCIDH
ncbi:MAG TPA: histidine kinase [Flavisolibacter sp.]|nr:histidine kinase [Flavisolibacter sp.]